MANVDLGTFAATPETGARGTARSWPPPGIGFIARLAPTLFVPLVLLALWQASATRGWVAEEILPAPATVGATFRELVQGGDIAANLSISLRRIAWGFGIGAGLGFLFGILLGTSPRARRLLAPTFRALATVPSLGWLPILILVFGIDEALKVIIIAKAAFVPMAINTQAGIEGIPTGYREVAQVLQLRALTRFFRLTAPAALPSLFTGVRLALGHAFVALVVVEMLAANEGLGYMMTWGRTLFQNDIVLVGIALVGAIGFALDRVLWLVESRLRRGLPAGAMAVAPAAGRAGWPALATGAFVPALAVVAWLLAVDTGLVSHPLLVPLHKVALVAFADPSGNQIWAALAASLLRVLAGFAIGGGLGLILGLALGLSESLERSLGPTLHALRQVTVFAWIPLLTAWFGNGEGSKLAFVALSTFFPLLLAAEQGIRDVPSSYREVAAVLHLPTRRRLTRLLLPAAAPSILVGVQLAFIAAWIGTVGAEYAIGNGLGLGGYLASAREQFRMDIVLVGVLALATTGIIIHRVTTTLIRRALPWTMQ